MGWAIYRKPPERTPRDPKGWLRLKGVTRNNLNKLQVAFPKGVLTTVTGVSGSGKSSLVSQVLVELVARGLGHELPAEEPEGDELEHGAVATLGGEIASGMAGIARLVRVDQKPIGRTPRSNLATYTGLFDHIRNLFAATAAARSRRYDAGAGEEGGRVVASGPPAILARATGRTAPYLARYLGIASGRYHQKP